MMANGVELSVDNAETWKTLLDTEDDPVTCIDVGAAIKSTKRAVYWIQSAGRENSIVYCSFTGGRSIYSQSVADYAVMVKCCQTKPSVAYFFTQEGKQPPRVFKTTDYGLEWVEVTPADTWAGNDHNHTAFDVSKNNPDILALGMWYSDDAFWVSRDGGATWSKELPGGPDSFELWQNTAVRILSDGTVLGGRSTNQIEILDTGGGVRYAGGAPSNNFVYDIDYASVGGGTVLAVGAHPEDPYGILVSKDGGASFTDMHSSSILPPGWEGRSRCAVSMSGKSIYLTVVGVGLYKSSDYGATWELVLAASSEKFRDYGWVVADPIEEDWVWATMWRNGKSTAAIWLSKNGGKTWRMRRSYIDFLYLEMWYSFSVGYNVELETFIPPEIPPEVTP
jgi:hypothetical protein